MTRRARTRSLAFLLFLVVGAVAGLTGCNKGHSKMKGPLSGTEMSPWKELTVPGMQLYLVHEKSPPYRQSGVARVKGSIRYLRGKKAFEAARSRVGNDPTKLAMLAMLFVDDGAAGQKPWTHKLGQQVPEQQAIARPPHLAGDTLVYWRFHSQLADLVRCKVTLDSGKVDCELGGEVLQRERMAQKPAETVKQELASDNVNERISGIEGLGQIGDDHARTQLIDMALNKYDYREREAAVRTLGKLGGPGVVKALSRVLLYDQYADVRQAAAKALGELHDPAARDALKKAETGDANGRVQVLAAQALKQLHDR